ncbi:PREDICTED: acid phosphatase 1-like isoform X2 [Lupinus angustifolius]|uniref:acid phosphatase 1-like isoform X2 n=1 Tax=Lupinus angustifolius TaxID=3871 RepID=UPI00092E4A16|nr:PREDICTED: acid phosphatase 1-like isoform X2 [Lupinus angustifolius]
MKNPPPHVTKMCIQSQRKMVLKRSMVQRVVEGITYLFELLVKFVLSVQKDNHHPQNKDDSYGLSWRLAVETNNVRGWKTVPPKCYKHVEKYMTGGQYEVDLKLIVDQILGYVSQISVASDGLDAWILDVDDTCISNISYYKAMRFGCDPFDSSKFKPWIMKGMCPANPVVLGLFNKLIERGFKVFLLTGRDQATHLQITTHNLHDQGFNGYHRLILRSAEYKGLSAVRYKSMIRKELEREGYRIWGNVGDQWSDLQGDSLGQRTFKLPNPMYCIS